MGKAQYWLDEEISLLKEKYPISTKDELIKMFPNRSWKSISGKADKFKLRKIGDLSLDIWTMEDIDVLKQNYKTSSEQEFMKLLPNRTWRSILDKASKLKLRKYNKYKDKYTNWTEDELIKLCNESGYIFHNTVKDENKKRRITVECCEGHIRDVDLGNFVNWNDCPECSGRYKKSFNEAKQIIEAEGYILLSKECDYYNSHSELHTICPNGHKYETKLTNFIHGTRCNFCYYETIKDRCKLSYEELVDRFDKAGYILEKDQEYKNLKDIVKCYCKKHKSKGLLEIPCYEILYNTKINSCKYCEEELKIQELKEKYNIYYILFKNKNLILVSSVDKFVEYKLNNINGYLYYRCQKHNEKGVQKVKIGNLRISNFITSCKYCVKELIKGEKHYRWKGGISSLSEYLRHKILPWKIDAFIFHNHICDITKNKYPLVIHHVYPFSKIVQDTLVETNLPLYNEINKYTDDELLLLENKCLQLHYKHGFGICLDKNVHKLFHNIYGCFNNTIEQYNQFKIDYTNGKFNVC